MGRMLGLFVFLVSLSSASASVAKGEFWECTINNHERGRGWISPTIGIVLREDGTAEVVDAVILNHYKVAIPGKVLRNNDRRLTVSWVLENIRADNGTSFAKFQYRLTADKIGGKARISAQPRNFDSGLNLQGACQRRTDRKLR